MLPPWFHECLFSVDIGDKIMAKNKRRDSGNAFMVKDDLVQLNWSPTEGLSQVAPLSWRLH